MKVKKLIIKWFNKVKGFFPTSLPQGMTEFNSWSQVIIDTYAPPMNDRSVKFTLSALLMRLGQDEAYKPNRYFAKCLHSGAAKQVGAYVMEEIKEEQRKEYAEQQESVAKQSEVTPMAETSDVQQPVQH